MQHALNEMLMGLRKSALRGLFSTNNHPHDRMRTLLQAVYLSQDYGINVPMLVIDGNNSPYVYSREQLRADIQLLVKSKERSSRRIYRDLLRCFYSNSELETALKDPEALYQKCVAFFSESVLPTQSEVIDSPYTQRID
jgi:hypothetical protein